MVDNKDLTVNFLPSPTWNRLGVNRAKIRNIPVDGWNSIPVQKEIIEKYINNSDSKIRDSFANIQTGMGLISGIKRLTANATATTASI